MEVSMHVTEICNLNCKACFHMIPISDSPVHYYIEYIDWQVNLLKKYSSLVESFNIMGGEPTLHPDIISILYIVRHAFPNKIVRLCTNGTNLKIFEEDSFLNALKFNDIAVKITEYPYSMYAEKNYESIYRILDERGIKHENASTLKDNYKFLIQPFHKDIINDISQPSKCKTFYYCVMLKDGKLYKCHLAAYISSLHNRFPDTSWIEDDESYIDLSDSTITSKDILDRLGRLSKICKHCVELNRGWKSDNPEDITDWGRSKGEKSEWVKE